MVRVDAAQPRQLLGEGIEALDQTDGIGLRMFRTQHRQRCIGSRDQRRSFQLAQVGGKPVGSPQELAGLAKALPKGEPVPLLIQREEARLFLPLTITG